MEVKNPNEALKVLAVAVDISEEAKEVDALAFTPPSELLSLPKPAEELLFSFLSTGKGSPQELLNLRLVCPTTKKWVDDLPLHQGRRLFSECQARVDANTEGRLESFLKTPPPSHVTSLYLKGVDSEFNTKIDLWNDFVKFWSPSFKCLQLDEVSLPLNCRLRELVTSTSIRKLRCERISCGGPADIADFLLNLEELWVDLDLRAFHRKAIDDPQKQGILRILGSVERLVIPDWEIFGTWESSFAAEVLRIRKHDVRSKLTFSFANHSFNFSSDTLADELSSFVPAVLASPLFPSIRVRSVTENFLRRVVFFLGQETALKFFRCVKSIKDFSPNSDNPFCLMNFPNLRRVNFDEGDVRGPIELPRSLKFLTIGEGLPSGAILSPFLTSLELQGFECSAVEVVRSLNLISESCPRLEDLDVDWTCDCQEEEEKKEEVRTSPEDGLLFPNLRSLSLSIEDAYMQSDEFVEAARLVLLKGLALPRLSLTTLFVRYGGHHNASPAPVFDVALLSSLIKGPSGKMLCEGYIEKNWVAEGAQELLGTLEGISKDWQT